MYLLGTDTIPILDIGVQGENGVTPIEFDFGNWQEEYGSGSIVLRLQRSGETTPYQKTLSISGTVATWTVDDTDTAVKGKGKAQILYYVDDKLKATEIFLFKVAKSIVDGTEIPEAFDDWLNTLLELGEEAREIDARIIDNTDTCDTQAANALASAKDSEAWAVGTRGGTPVGSTDQTYNNNAKYWSQRAKLSQVRMREGYITTTSGVTSTITIDNDFTSDEMIIVDINGLTLIQGVDYTISGHSITLTTPLTTSGQIVHWVVFTTGTEA